MTATTSAQPAIFARGITKRYGDKQAAAGVDLTVERGEIFAILGPNGAGKTTTVKILEGFRSRDGGEVVVLGADPGKAGRQWRSQIGVVLQDSSDLGDITVTEALTATAQYYPNPRDVRQVIAAVGLAEKATARLGSLSGGQRRRVDVALGIIGSPELLFLDEPTTGFDPAARRQFWELIRSLRAGGTTIVLTTHYLDEAAALADRVAVICDGVVVACAPPAALGGPDARTPIVGWIDQTGEQRYERTTTPTATVQRLATSLGSSTADGEVANLSVTKPSLEDVYLNLINSQTSEIS